MMIRIFDTEWTVLLMDAHAPELTVGDTICRGATWCGHYKIYLSKELTAATAMRTIRHEITHAFIWVSQIRIPDSIDEEYLCDFLAAYADRILEASELVYKELYYGKINTSV